jgi:L-Ala-D/L-Glu epimerase
MRITSITTYPIDVPVSEAWKITSSLGSHHHTRVLLIRLDTDAGAYGLGEATVAPVWSGESALGAKAMIEGYLAPVVVGRAVSDIAGALAAMDRGCWANPFAKSAIEMAMLDAWGKAEGRPVYDLLGGAARGLALPIRFSLAAASPEATAENARRRVAWGHRTVKVKVGLDPKADVARVRAVREAIGPDVRLTVDANGGWSVEDAVRALNEMRPLELTLAEQPVRREDLDGMAEVRRRVEVPVMADEGVFTIWDAQQALKKESCDIISVYPGKNGGITISKRIAELAAERGVACAVGSNLELDPGTAAMCHLSVATANIAAEKYHGDILGPLYHEASVVKDPLRLENGTVWCPDRPGLGVEADWEVIERLRLAG